MRTLVEVEEEKDAVGENGEVLYAKNKYWLWHFGIEFKIIETEKGLMPVNYTVAICENYKTGEIMTFMPSQLRIIGKVIKE